VQGAARHRLSRSSPPRPPPPSLTRPFVHFSLLPPQLCATNTIPPLTLHQTSLLTLDKHPWESRYSIPRCTATHFTSCVLCRLVVLPTSSTRFVRVFNDSKFCQGLARLSVSLCFRPCLICLLLTDLDSIFIRAPSARSNRARNSLLIDRR
jgi:hypothetical protein